MTQVIFDVVDLVGEVHPGDQVSVWPPHVTATVDGRVQSTRKIDVLVDEGPVTREVEPGPLVVQLQCRGIADTKPRTVTIPDEGTITLANLLHSTFTYTPAVVSQVTMNAQRAEDAADRAENVVDTVQWQGDQLSVMGKVSPPLTGDDGATPYVGENGTWWVGETDTGVRAQGEKGDSGDGAGDVLWSELNPILDGKAPESHTHPSTGISDATTVGRSVLTASSQAAARQAIGAGTSSLGLGSTSDTAAPGNHTHSQYAESSRVTALEGSQPIIVSSLPASPLPGRIYLVTGA